MLECPALSETTLIGTPSIRSCVIWLWRSPRMLTCGMSSASMVRENRRERVLGMIATPLWSVNKRSFGSRPSPSWSRTAACSALCFCDTPIPAQIALFTRNRLVGHQMRHEGRCHATAGPFITVGVGGVHGCFCSSASMPWMRMRWPSILMVSPSVTVAGPVMLSARAGVANRVGVPSEAANITEAINIPATTP